MITFILNKQKIQTDKAPGISLLDFIRYEMDIYGTKIGCREGDCGACTVLEGQLIGKKVSYKSIVSCLTPLGNVHGKHIVTIEGINMKHLSPVQKALVDHSGTQCGFCTPGFVMSLTAHNLLPETSDKQKAIASISGNICRCTGYKSIERAANNISELLKNKDIENPILWLVNQKFLPDYFLEIGSRLEEIEKTVNKYQIKKVIVGGGTDLMVRKPEVIARSYLNLFQNRAELKGIKKKNEFCVIGGATTTSEIMQSAIMQEIIPDIKIHFKLISSESIRNMGTIAGNIINASPIGDLSIFFLALNAEVYITDSKNNRTIPLKDFFLDYKKLAIKESEFITDVAFSIPKKSCFFNFEKVSKRTHLDIASVNSAICVSMNEDIISNCSISIGGVSPIPLFLRKTCNFLKSKTLSGEILMKANKILQEEISPIGDVRGSIEYKRLLARQLLFAHFLKLFPAKNLSRALLS